MPGNTPAKAQPMTRPANAQCPGHAWALLCPPARLMLDGYAVRLRQRNDPPPLSRRKRCPPPHRAPWPRYSAHGGIMPGG